MLHAAQYSIVSRDGVTLTPILLCEPDGLSAKKRRRRSLA